MFTKKFIYLILAPLFLLISCKGGIPEIGGGKCPKLEDFQKTIDSIQKGISLEKIENSPILGLCEVVVKLPEGERGIFYTDSSGKFIVSGNIIDISVKKNLTAEKLALLNKRVLSPENLKELDKVVAFTWGNASKYVYFITDPDCPFCKQAEGILEELVTAGKLSVKVILFPLEPIHPEAKAKSISIICDNKGFEGLKRGYLSKNQCESGKSIVESSINLMQKLRVRGTPTFVFPDGEIKSGVLSAEVILNKLGVK
ncbi:MAG: DsbC family protein [Caldimicrobium sp.]